MFFTLLISSLHDLILYPLMTSIYYNLYPAINVAILLKLYLPDPPTPSSNAFPFGYLSTLVILLICSHASKNSTSFIKDFPFFVKSGS